MRIAVFVLLVSISGCSDLFGPAIPPATPYPAPEIYLEWWQEVHADLSIKASLPHLDRILWFEVHQGAWFSKEHGHDIWGLWTSKGRIYIARGCTLDEGIIKHEMLHEILGPRSRDHSHPLFFAYTDPTIWIPLESCI